MDAVGFPQGRGSTGALRQPPQHQPGELRSMRLAVVLLPRPPCCLDAPRACGHTYGKLNPWAVGSAALAAEGESNFETSEKRSPQVS